jgi:hypothetical protein
MSKKAYLVTGHFSSVPRQRRVWADNEDEAMSLFEERALENVDGDDVCIDSVELDPDAE